MVHNPRAVLHEPHVTGGRQESEVGVFSPRYGRGHHEPVEDVRDAIRTILAR
jgi:hypothetical protein